jgi:type IV secretion system protein VirB1
VGFVAEVLVPLTLAALFSRCAPNVGPVTMAAIVVHESAAQPYAIGDNTARRSYTMHDAAGATALARALLRSGHNIDIGYGQINSSNLAPYGLDVARAFEPCTNVATASRILRRDYAGARLRFGPGQVALAHALSAYNSGGYYAGMSYARDVYATAAGLRYDRRVSRARLLTNGRAVAFHRGPQHGSDAK